MKLVAVALAVVTVLLAGCASYSGSSLVAGQSSAKDVEALMGEPAARVTVEGGDAVWFYSRQPFGRETYAVRLSSAGLVRSVEQVLTVDNLKKITVGATSARQLRELLGPPWRVSRLDRVQREVWEYTMLNSAGAEYFLYVQLSPDGIVRETILMKDYSKEVGGDKD